MWATEITPDALMSGPVCALRHLGFWADVPWSALPSFDLHQCDSGPSFDSIVISFVFEIDHRSLYNRFYIIISSHLLFVLRFDLESQENTSIFTYLNDTHFAIISNSFQVDPRTTLQDLQHLHNIKRH